LFLSVADYPNPVQATESFRTSASFRGIELKYISWGEQWQGFVQNKVEKTLKYLKDKAKHHKYAFVLDCADIVFTKPLDKILQQFNRFYDGGVWFNCDYDGVMWPLADPLLQWHIHTNYGRNGIVNAGAYCGVISDIIALLEQILDVRQQILTKNYKQLCTKMFSASKSCGYEKTIFDSKGQLIDDDQWLLHIIQTEYNPLIKTDKQKQIFALIENYPTQPRSIYDRDCIGTAGILHISHVIQNRKN
jgi:hypothetical protein